MCYRNNYNVYMKIKCVHHAVNDTRPQSFMFCVQYHNCSLSDNTFHASLNTLTDGCLKQMPGKFQNALFLNKLISTNWKIAEIVGKCETRCLG